MRCACLVEAHLAHYFQGATYDVPVPDIYIPGALRECFKIFLDMPYIASAYCCSFLMSEMKIIFFCRKPKLCIFTPYSHAQNDEKVPIRVI